MKGFILLCSVIFSQKCQLFKQENNLNPNLSKFQADCAEVVHYNKFVPFQQNPLIYKPGINNIGDEVNLVINKIEDERFIKPVSQTTHDFYMYLLTAFTNYNNCYSHMKFFVCLLLFPQCIEDDNAILYVPPCQEMCLDFQKNCTTQIHFLETNSELSTSLVYCEPLPKYENFDDPNQEQYCTYKDLFSDKIKPTRPPKTDQNVISPIPSIESIVPKTNKPKTTVKPTSKPKRTPPKLTEPPPPFFTTKVPKTTISPQRMEKFKKQLPSQKCLVECTKECKDCSVKYCTNFGNIKPSDTIKMSKYIADLKLYSSFHASICDWIEQFLIWREQTFTAWMREYNNFISREQELKNYLDKTMICNVQKTSKYPCAKDVKAGIIAVKDAHGCVYNSCEITYKENYIDLYRYWQDDEYFWETHLSKQWQTSWDIYKFNADKNNPKI